MNVRVTYWLLSGLVVIQAFLLGYLAKTSSPTWDEPGHLVAGLSHWQFGKFDLYTVNPPLVRTLAAAPVHFLMQPELDWTLYSSNPAHRSEVALGHDFVELNGARTLSMLFVARLMVIPLALLGTLICYLFARDLFASREAGLGAAVLWALSPSVLGHGALIAPDVPTASLGLLAAYMFWKFLNIPSWSSAIVLGIATALAMLTKSTWLVLPIIFASVWLVVVVRHYWQAARGRLAAGGLTRFSCVPLAMSMIWAVGLVNAFYGFSGSFQPLKKYTFVSRLFGDEVGQPIPVPVRSQAHPIASSAITQVSMNVANTQAPAPVSGPCPYCTPGSTPAASVPCADCVPAATDGQAEVFDIPPGNRFRSSALGYLPVPLPQRYLEGIDIQRRDFESGLYRPEWASYFAGSWQQGGWWYYYIVGLFHKSPIALWFLLPLSTAWVLIVRQTSTLRWGAICLWAPALAMLLLLSANTGLNRYLRYALPILPAICIWAGGAFVCLASRAQQSAASQRWLIAGTQVSALLLLVLYAGSSLSAAPHWLSYFNVAAGGPANGHLWYNDSNIDWGQDLGRVANWIEEHPEAANDLSLAYFGSFNPASLGIKFKSPVPTAQDLARLVMRSPDLTDPRPGWYILSKNYVTGHPMPIFGPDGTLRHLNGSLSYFKKFQPVDRIGHSMLVYHLDQRQVDQFRVALKMPIVHPLVPAISSKPTQSPTASAGVATAVSLSTK